MAQQEQHSRISQDRRRQVGSGERSEKIRTYNFPQSRISDHRLNESFYNLEAIMDGDLSELIEKLVIYYQARALEEDKSQETLNQPLEL